MNTVRSVGYGWFVLIAAGGGAYYFAKRSINADREQRYNSEQERKALQAQFREYEMYPKTSSNTPKSPNLNGSGADEAGNPSREANADPAPTRHAPETDAQRVGEKSKYEASEVWRSKKGDRFS